MQSSDIKPTLECHVFNIIFVQDFTNYYYLKWSLLKKISVDNIHENELLNKWFGDPHYFTYIYI